MSHGSQIQRVSPLNSRSDKHSRKSGAQIRPRPRLPHSNAEACLRPGALRRQWSRRHPNHHVVAAQPGEQHSFGNLRALERHANFIAQRQRRRQFFHRQAQHGRQQAQQSQQILLGRSQRAKPRRQFAESRPAQRPCAKPLPAGRLFSSLVMASVAMRRKHCLRPPPSAPPEPSAPPAEPRTSAN